MARVSLHGAVLLRAHGIAEIAMLLDWNLIHAVNLRGEEGAKCVRLIIQNAPALLF